jgi:hypothetical protein
MAVSHITQKSNLNKKNAFMIKHIVLFKFRENLPEQEKTQKLHSIKADLEDSL